MRTWSGVHCASDGPSCAGGGRHTLGETKTRRGRRLVNLTPRTVTVLKAHRKRQLERRVELAGMYEDHDLIFASEIGPPSTPRTS